MLSVKQGSTWDWTSVSWTIGKHSTDLGNVQILLIIKIIKLYLRDFGK